MMIRCFEPAARLGAFLRDRRANFAVMAALSAPFAVSLAAVAIDEGSLYTERREVQALADLAAITAAANLGNAETAALTTLSDNGIRNAGIDNAGDGQPGTDRTLVSVTRGHYDPSAAPGARFTPGGAAPFNAARVSMRRTGTLYFGSAIMAPPVIGATAIASASAQAAFSIGSGLAEANTENSALLNPILGGLLGTSLSLRAVDYRALADTDVELLSFIDALATRLDITAGTYDSVLDADASVADIAHAIAGIRGLDGTSRAAVDAIAAKASATARLSLGRLIDLGPLGRLGIGQQGGSSVQANILEMLTAAAALADGGRQVAIDLRASVPGLASVSLGIAVGEPPQNSPWLAVGDTGTTVYTAQIRIRLIVGIGGLGGLLGKVVTLPLYLDIARAEGRLADISCRSGRPDSLRVTVDATPGVADLRIADIGAAAMNDFSRVPAMAPARLVDVSILGLGLVSVSGQARTTVGNTEATPLVFNHADIGNRTVKSVSAENLAGSLAASLFGDLQLEARVLGLNIPVPDGIVTALGTTLGAVSAPVDSLLDALLRLLGVRVSYADVRVNGATCSRSVLVQ